MQKQAEQDEVAHALIVELLEIIEQCKPIIDNTSMTNETGDAIKELKERLDKVLSTAAS